jgi:hypothetical protein
MSALKTMLPDISRESFASAMLLSDQDVSRQQHRGVSWHSPVTIGDLVSGACREFPKEKEGNEKALKFYFKSLSKLICLCR